MTRKFFFFLANGSATGRGASMARTAVDLKLGQLILRYAGTVCFRPVSAE
jgi:hypothetical protein